MIEAERFLKKARESLASAEADTRAGRYNSAANRAYYAAFQAAVAALIHWGARGWDTEWQHRFVSSEFSTMLIRRRKLFPAELRRALPELFRVRITADYEIELVTRSAAQRCVAIAGEMVSAVALGIEQARIDESSAAHIESMTTKFQRSPQQFVEDVKSKILESYPSVSFDVRQRAERDFTLRAYGEYEEMWKVPEVLGDMTIDLLDDHDVWIVVLGLTRQPQNN